MGALSSCSDGQDAAEELSLGRDPSGISAADPKLPVSAYKGDRPLHVNVQLCASSMGKVSNLKIKDWTTGQTLGHPLLLIKSTHPR